ncbi:MAG: caspase, EACC1-associated type [Nostoc sp. ChiQUE02]|uniref:caspase, EACC1-associated type n=1 Tax=Nostoc sp. ChiQUE02 TaxID=3075377 RepID=UPI002AD2BC93|nr:ABC transporter substrate-binding protein [Nostoc sp. ChiQUE02]MDZ8228733.1 ABC transporter substrate-binding protein [Nostoc sp. ChiQUE02]
MAKVALLIGVSEYESGLNPLPAATKDVEAMQRVLLHLKIGGFDDVTLLINPQQYEMAVAIETLFDNRQKDDLLLLFFSGHGIKDESGKLYFAACNTRKTDKGVLVKATTVPAIFVHEVMSNSRSRREVVILDCCFSGAFAEGLSAKDNGFVDIRNQLGGEGRAVLTSSTSTQYSFEQQGADTSTYTRYIVEGLETGAADRDEDGWISVDELHEYATKAVQEAAPAMKPEIYAIKEGYKINLARAPIDDPNLKYRREVDYWVESGNGEISATGRVALEGLQEELQLAPIEAAAIETKVLAPIEVYKKKLQRYEQAFRNEIKLEFPPSDKTRANLKRLQQALGLRDEDIALIEAPIIAEQPLTATPVVVNTSDSQKKNFKYYVGTCIIGLVIGVVFGGTLVYVFRPITIASNIGDSCANKEEHSLNDSISLGEEVLLKQYTNSDKETGVKAFANSNCKTAIDSFTYYRRTNFRDPETLIYLNNAKARQKGNWLKIAVSVPIAIDPYLAEEILRGVAQAQDEVNNNNGINSKLLQVAIANDDEKPGTATKIAKALVADQEILGVVGPASSNATLEAGNVYNTEGLIAISPTSTSVNISNFSSYVFRTVSSDEVAAQILAKYMVKNLQKQKVAVFFVFGSSYSKSLTDEFIKYLPKESKVFKEAEFNFSKSNFNAETAVKQAISQGAEVLMLASDSETLDKTYKVIRANNRKLYILGGDNIFGQSTLNSLGKQADGMVVAIPWHIGNASNSNFVKNSEKLWKATVNWRTATAYDATLAISKGLQQNNTREGLKQVLHSPDFSVDGATGTIQFTKSGDRTNKPILLVQVRQIPGTDKYEFVPIQP